MSISYEELIRLRHMHMEENERSKSVDRTSYIKNNNTKGESSNANLSSNNTKSKSNKLEPLKNINMRSLKRLPRMNAGQHSKTHEAVTDTHNNALSHKQDITYNTINQNSELLKASKFFLQPAPPSQSSASLLILPSLTTPSLPGSSFSSPPHALR